MSDRRQALSKYPARPAELICIACPFGCALRVKNLDPLEIEGNRCPRGKEYAEQEIRDPRRVLTTTVRLRGARFPRLPVRTDRPIPKDRLFDCMNEIARVEIQAPVRVGDVVIRNPLGLDVNVVATMSASEG